MTKPRALKSIKGMHDLLPEESSKWQALEAACRQVCAQYGYQEMRSPILEPMALFKRAVGQETDIVGKEMYSFADRDGEMICLRPEGTASAIRAMIQAGLLNQQPMLRTWYLGPMFRHERPQLGRLRQFHQIGVESYGVALPAMDAEVIALSFRLLRELGLKGKVKLQLNSLGSSEARQAYRQQLVSYLQDHKAKLDEDSLRRLDSNPLRILDSKNPEVQQVVAGAPLLIDHLDSESADHFAELQNLLGVLGIDFELNPTLVRGLDYYNRTVFEWVTDELGAQGTVCAGGRYDNLVEQLGGKACPAIGFAAGLERLLLLASLPEKPAVDVYVIVADATYHGYALEQIDQLRAECPDLRVELNLQGSSFKSQFKKADKSGANYAIVIAEDEVKAGKLSLKALREDVPQELLNLKDMALKLKTSC